MLKKNKIYHIPFAGLKPGSYSYVFLLDKDFFSEWTAPDVEDGKVQVNVDMERSETMLTFHFSFSGEVRLLCDRCADPFQMHVEGSHRLIVKLAREAEEINEELVTISRDESEFDVAPFLYEFLYLSLPAKRTHPEDENGKTQCDPAVLSVLHSMSVQEGGHNGDDPRWGALKGLSLQ